MENGSGTSNQGQGQGQGQSQVRTDGGGSRADVGPDMNAQLDELRGRFDEAMGRAGQFIRERPGMSLLIAAGAGYLVGRIVRS